MQDAFVIKKAELILKYELKIHGIDITEVDEAFKIIVFLKEKNLKVVHLFADGVIVEKI